MALVLKDRIKETTTTTGTADYTLGGAFSGFRAFSEIGDGNTTYYVCEDGTDYEIGIGGYTASGNTLSRSDANVLVSSNSNNRVDWAAGEKNIFVAQPADKAVFLNASGDLDLNGRELILDADGDTSIAGFGDDMMAFKLGLVDRLRITTGHLRPTSNLGLALGSSNHRWSRISGAEGNFNDQMTLGVADGTAPLIITSTTKVANLNADRLDDLEATDFATAAQGTTADAALPKTGGVMSGNLDLNGNELILDEDGDTSITADTDDVVHFKVGGNDELTLNSLYLRPSVNQSLILGHPSFRWDTIYGDTLNISGAASISGVASANQLVLQIADGTAPIAVTSTTKVDNLNVDKLDDQDGSYYLDAGNLTGTIDNARLDGELAALAGLTSAADKGIQFTGSGTAATFDLTTAGKALLDDANATAQRATLGLGSAATSETTDFATAAQGTVADAALPKTGGIMSGNLDLNGNELILDADGDTSITADTDNIMDFRISGTDEVELGASYFRPKTNTGSSLGSPNTRWLAVYSSVGYFNGAINLQASQGTAPLIVTSTTKVDNLNVDKLDDQDGSYYLDASNLTGTVDNARLDQQLQDVAGLAVTDGNFIVGDGSNFVAESGSTARASLGLGSAATANTSDFATAAQGTTADAALPKAGGTMTGAIAFASGQTFDGRDVSALGDKLDNIEANATADQTATEIKTLYESNSDTNAFTDADHTKLDGIEASATADQTATEILTAIKTVDGANSGLDADLLDGQEGSYYTTYADNAVAALVDSAPTALDTLNELAAALGDDANFSTTVNTNIASKLPLAGGTMTGAITFASGQLFDTRDVSADGTKLDGIESGATADQTAAEIRALVDSASDSNVFTDADHTKLDGIETSADVTDTANVTAAGALMDSEVTNLSQVKTFDSSDYATAAQGSTADAAMPKTGGTFTNDVTFSGTSHNIVFDRSDNAFEFPSNAKAVFGPNATFGLQILHNTNALIVNGAGDLILATNEDDKDVRLRADDGSGGLIDYIKASGSTGEVILNHYGSEKFKTTTGGISVTGEVAATSLDISGDVDVDGTLEADAITLDGTALGTAATSAASDFATAAQGTAADAALPKSGGQMTGNLTFSGQQTVDGRDVSADGTKLDGIESGATADQTASEIRTLVGSASDSNVFTDADHTKLDGIESGATADQTAAEIRTLVGSATDSNVFTDADHTKLDGIEASADVTDASNVAAAGALMDSEVTNLAQVKAFDSSDYATAAQGTTADAALPKTGGIMSGSLDLDGNELILDADGDTSITADTDDVIDFRIGGSDEMEFSVFGLRPKTNFGKNLGSSSQRWSTIYGFAGQFTTKITLGQADNGTAPMDVTSTTKVDNLNADKLDDQEGSYYLNAANLTGTVDNARLDAQLQDVAGLAVTDGGFIVGDGSNFVLETGSTARASLGLGTAATSETGDFATAAQGTKADAALPKAGGTMTGSLNLNANELLLSADGDESITADQGQGSFSSIDFKVVGTDRLILTSSYFRPKTNNTMNLGSSVARYLSIYAGTADFTSLAVDNITIDGNAITSTDTNGNITITPNGTGSVVIDGLSYPQADGSAGQFLKTDGSGNLSFDTVSGGGGGGSVAADDITTGDAAVEISTTASSIIVDAQGNDGTITFKGTDGGSDINALSLQMASGGFAAFNAGATFKGDVTLTSGTHDLTFTGDASRIAFPDQIRFTHVADTGVLLDRNYNTVELQLYDSNESVGSDGTNLLLKSGGTSFKVPTSDGSSGQFLKTDGSGNLSFDTVSGGGSGIASVSADTNPSLGGDLQSNGNNIDLADSDKLIAGTGSDLEFYHDGSHSYIDHVGAADQTLYIRNTTGSGTTDGVVIETKASSPNYIHLANNGAVRLGINGSDKLSVISAGTYFNNDIILNTSSYDIKFRNGTYYTTLAGTAATADHTVTVPNATGTVALDESTGMTLNNGVIALKNGGTQSEVRLYCESSNAHYAALKAPAHANFAGNVTSTLPSVTGTLIGTANADAPATTTSSSDADHVLVNDGGVLKKISPSDLGIGGGGGGSYANSDVDAHLNTSTASANEVLSWTGSDYDWVSNAGGSAADGFKTISVSGQSDVVADSSADTLTLVAGSNMTITTNASGDSITFASSGSGGGSSTLSGLSDVTISSVGDGDVLRYNGSASEWQNTNIGVTLTPTFTMESTNLPSNQQYWNLTVTNHSSLSGDDVHYRAAIYRTSDDALIVNPTSVLVNYLESYGQFTGTIRFTTTGSAFNASNEGTSYYIKLTAQTFGDLESSPATYTFQVVAPPQVSMNGGSYRYWRLTEWDNRVFLYDWRLYDDINQGGNEYPSTNSPSYNSNKTQVSWTSDGQTNVLTASGAHSSSSYGVGQCMDYYTTSTGYWTLFGSSQSTANNYYPTITCTWDAGTARTLKSMKLVFNDTYTNTVSGSQTAVEIQGSNDGTNWTVLGTATPSDEDFSATSGLTTVLFSDTS